MNINNKECSTEYWQAKTDRKKLALCFLRKLWLVIAGVIAGIVISVIAYFAYHAVADGVIYEGYSEFYLEFAVDETGEVYQYYNGYTWNDLMSTDLIADGTMSRLSDTSITIAELEESTRAEIKSDIRVLRVTFTNSDLDKCTRLQSATEASLEELGDNVKEFIKISNIKTVGPERVYADDRLKQAILLGAILGLLVILLVLFFISILDDRILVPSDIMQFAIPVLGVSLKEKDSKLEKKISAITNVTLKEDAARINILDYIENSKELAGAESIVVEIPYNKVSVSYLNLFLNMLKNSNCKVEGLIITEADNSFYKFYL